MPTTFPLSELYSKLSAKEQRLIEVDQLRRDERFKGDFDKHARRILRINTYSAAATELTWLTQHRPDIPKYKIKILEWQLLAKFDVAKHTAWKHLRRMFLPVNGYRPKSTEPSYTELCAYLFHVICIEVMGEHTALARIVEFMRCFTDEEFSKFLHKAAESQLELIPKYFVGQMLLRPNLIESQKDYIVMQMKSCNVRYQGFARIAILFGKMQFCFFNVEQTDILAELFIKELEDMHVLPVKRAAAHYLDDLRSCTRYRTNEAKMIKANFDFFKNYAVKRGLCGENIRTVGDLICVIPPEADYPPIRQFLTFAFLHHRRLVPAVEKRGVMGLWTHDFEWNRDLNKQSPPARDANFSYHACFQSLARFINRFDMYSEGFRLCLRRAGGDAMLRLILLALIYESQYEQALALANLFIGDRSYDKVPHLHFTRMIVLVRLKQFDAAIGHALTALVHANKKGKSWKSMRTAPCLLRWRKSIEERLTDYEDEEDMDEYLEEEEVKLPMPKSTVHLITERDTAYYTCILLLNIVRSSWSDDETKRNLRSQVLIALSQFDFASHGRHLFEEVMAEIEKRQSLDATALLPHLQNRHVISCFSGLLHRAPEASIVFGEGLHKSKSETDEEKADRLRKNNEVLLRAHLNACAKGNDAIASIASFLACMSSEVFAGIRGNEGKEGSFKLIYHPIVKKPVITAVKEAPAVEKLGETVPKVEADGEEVAVDTTDASEPEKKDQAAAAERTEPSGADEKEEEAATVSKSGAEEKKEEGKVEVTVEKTDATEIKKEEKVTGATSDGSDPEKEADTVENEGSDEQKKEGEVNKSEKRKMNGDESGVACKKLKTDEAVTVADGECTAEASTNEKEKEAEEESIAEATQKEKAFDTTTSDEMSETAENTENAITAEVIEDGEQPSQKEVTVPAVAMETDEKPEETVTSDKGGNEVVKAAEATSVE